jgi:Fe-S-cluster containining protein
METLSLLEHCQKCNSKCCKASVGIGMPILSEKEASLMIFLWSKEMIQEVMGPSGEKYWVPRVHPSTNTCIFLKGDKCQAQTYKPMDCQCYPVKAIHQGEKIVYVIDQDCPAVADLSPEFFEQTKKIAAHSLARFRPETYAHWLKNYIGWVKKSGKIIK